MKSLHFVFCIASMLCFSCSTLGGGPKLPEKRPADFIISFYEGGGMLPESEIELLRLYRRSIPVICKQVEEQW